MPAAIQHLDNDGITIITAQLWPDAVAGVTQTARKFCVQNVGDRVLENYGVSIEDVGTNDGGGEMRIALDTDTLSAPFDVEAALTGAGVGGVFSGTGIYYYKITAYNGTGETVGSVEVAITVDVTTKKVVLTWAQIANATGYKVYRSTTSGTYGASSLRDTVVGAATLTYTDDGAALSSGTVPSANSTGGAAPNYGTAPSLAIDALVFGDIEIYEMKFYWVNRVVPTGAPEAGNPRQAYLLFEEL